MVHIDVSYLNERNTHKTAIGTIPLLNEEVNSSNKGFGEYTAESMLREAGF